MNAYIPFSSNIGECQVMMQAQRNLPQRAVIIAMVNVDEAPFVDYLPELAHRPCAVVVILFPSCV